MSGLVWFKRHAFFLRVYHTLCIVIYGVSMVRIYSFCIHPT